MANDTIIFYADEYLKSPRNRVSLIEGDSKEITKDTQVFIKGILNTEEVGINISHSFTQSQGFLTKALDTLEGWTDKAKNFATQVQQLSSIMPLVNDIINQGDIASFGGGKVGGGLVKNETVKNFTKKATEIMGKVNYYSQSKLDFSDAYMYNFDGTSITSPVSFSQILLNDGGDSKTTAMKQLNAILDKLVGDYGEVGGFAGLTLAPHGFKTNLQGLKDESPDGTFTLYVDHYRFPGVVITDIDIDFSRTLVDLGNGEYEPLYILINYKTQPVIKYTKQTLMHWIKATKL